MATNIRGKQPSVVSNADGGGVVVRGRSGAGGRVIGEVMSGGRNISGVKPIPRQAPRPTRDSLRHGLHPSASPAPAADDYGDFGIGDGLDSYRDAAHGSAPTAEGRSDGLLRQRQDEFNLFTWLAQGLVAALGGLGLFFVLAVAVAVFGPDLAHEFPFLRVLLLPLLLALLCGYRVGAHAKRRLRQGLAYPSAVLGALFGALIVGAGFFACVRYIGFYPLFMVLKEFGAPATLVDMVNSRFDMSVFQVFIFFGKGAYAVVPLFGALLGWLFVKK